MKQKLTLLFILLCVLAAFMLTACAVDAEPVKEIKGISVQSFPKILYYEKDPLSLDGATISILYADDKKQVIPVTEDMVSGYNKDAVGKQTVTVSYKGKTALVEVEVRQLILQGVRLENKANGSTNINIQLIQGGALNMENYRLRLLFQDGHSAIIEKIDVKTMVSGYDPSYPAGQYVARVNYQNFYATFNVNAVPKDIDAVFVNKKPVKSEYFVGEVFNPAGLELTVRYDNNTQDTLALTEQNAEDFAFSAVESHIFESGSFVFAAESTQTEIKVTYKDDKSATFYVKIKKPLCIGMDIEFTDTEGNFVDGRPETYGIMREGQVYKSRIDGILEGDTINWGSGRAKLRYEYGEPKYIFLNDPSVNGRFSGYDTSVPGNYTIYLKYGEVEWSVPMNIIVKAKAPYKLLLSGTEDIESKTFVEGERINPDRVKYNVLYDNGNYLFHPEGKKNEAADLDDWQYLDVIDMLAPESTLTATYITADEGIQTVYYQYETVKAGIEVTVLPLEVVSFIVTPPVKNYYTVGTEVSEAATNGYIYVEYNNNTFRTLGFSDDGVELEYFFDGVGVAAFGQEGEYTVRITYRGVTGEYTLFAQTEIPVSLIVVNPPANNSFISFNDIDLSSIYIKAIYEGGFEETIPLNDDLLYNPDKMRLGYQSVVARYKGLTAEFAVNITGRRETAIEIKTAPKSVYLAGEQLDLSSLVIIKHFNDLSIPQEIREFPSIYWTFEIRDTMGNLSNLSTAGEKTLVIKYNAGSVSLVAEHRLRVYTDAQITAISFDAAQSQLSNITVGGESKRALRVTKGEELNTTGLKLRVHAGATAFDIDLLASYVEYDKGYELKDENGDVIPYRQVKINYAGQQTSMWIYVVYNRTVTSISVNNLPDITILPELMHLKLAGGTIQRHFSDGTSDILPMTSGLVMASGYETNPFASLAGGSENITSIEQVVTLTHAGKTTSFNITTHRKLRVAANVNLSYIDVVSFYGAVKVPSVEIMQSYTSFVIPQWTLDYYYEGHWIRINKEQGVYPKIPGTYPLKLNIIGNEYYEEMSVEGANIIIVKKIIEVRANDATKIYRNTDPTLTYWIEGDTVVDGQTVNTMLVWNNGIQDRLEIILERDPGENVLYGSTGEILGYAIRPRLAPAGSGNQNDRYIVDFKLGTFRIQPRVVNETIQFSGGTNLNEDGNPKHITAYYVVGGSTTIIEAKDIIYTDSQGNVLSGAPVSQGTYTATISKNYLISGIKSREFIIGPPL